nr:hypothetical protein [uncultured Desulfobacter sp.]
MERLLAIITELYNTKKWYSILSISLAVFLLSQGMFVALDKMPSSPDSQSLIVQIAETWGVDSGVDSGKPKRTSFAETIPTYEPIREKKHSMSNAATKLLTGNKSGAAKELLGVATGKVSCLKSKLQNEKFKQQKLLDSVEKYEAKILTDDELFDLMDQTRK